MSCQHKEGSVSDILPNEVHHAPADSARQYNEHDENRPFPIDKNNDEDNTEVLVPDAAVARRSKLVAVLKLKFSWKCMLTDD